MRKVFTICVSLEEPYVAILKRLAAQSGTKSAAVRRLLDAYERAERQRDMEQAYRAYFADRAAVKADQDLTEAMLSLATWDPPEKESCDGQKHPARRHLRAGSRQRWR